MARLERIEVTTDITRMTEGRPTAAGPIGHLVNKRRGWEVHCDVESCTATPADFDTTYLKASAALGEFLDHLEEYHGVTS